MPTRMPISALSSRFSAKVKTSIPVYFPIYFDRCGEKAPSIRLLNAEIWASE